MVKMGKCPEHPDVCTKEKMGLFSSRRIECYRCRTEFELKNGLHQRDPHSNITATAIPTNIAKYEVKFAHENKVDYGEQSSQGTGSDPDSWGYKGEFKDGVRHGPGKHTRTDGWIYLGEFKDDKYCGQGTLAGPDGTKYVGEFQDNKYCGPGTLTKPDGSMYVCQFKYGKLVRKGTLTK